MGRIENYWNGTILNTVDKVIDTIANITWKNIKITSVLLDKVYQKGVKLTEKEMGKREHYIQRNELLPKWDVLIKPSIEMGTLFVE